MSFYLSKRSQNRLIGVHPDLVKVVNRAIQITACDFSVLEGLRTVQRQKELLKAGASTTMNSRHLTGHAVDLGAYVSGSVRWDWPLYYQLADAMKAAAHEVNVPIEWGGDWEWNGSAGLKDGPHFQLPWASYPKAIG